MRQVTMQEWDEKEFIEATTIDDLAEGKRVFILGLKKGEPPDPPDDKYVYFSVETTQTGDEERSWKWIPAVTEEAKVDRK